MSVVEKRLIIVDDKRVLVVDDKGSTELHGTKLRQALSFLVEEPLPRKLAHPPAVAVDYDSPEAVSVPPRAKHVMPKGITRNATTRDHRIDDKYPPLTGSATLVLRTVAEIGAPTSYFGVVKRLADMPVGTVSSQLFALSERGYLSKTKSGHHAYRYAITAEGEEVLTCPDPVQEKLL